MTGRKGESMRYLWLVGLVAVAGLVLAAGLRAEESPLGGEGAKREHRAEKEGKEAGARGERPRPPEVKLTAEQEAALAPAVTELKAAIAKFKAAVKAAGLSEQDARAYTMQTIFGQLRSERPREGKKAGGETEGGTEK
jgi:flagellar biosynthesis/type III secretory pathway M-ring protein FliF/YscJ